MLHYASSCGVVWTLSLAKRAHLVISSAAFHRFDYLQFISRDIFFSRSSSSEETTTAGIAESATAARRLLISGRGGDGSFLLVPSYPPRTNRTLVPKPRPFINLQWMRDQTLSSEMAQHRM
eukprot:GHVQ01015757.1.p2 GENE.GHVQ01015757.1~~GHVQ01015757.1.p2  ORF type:complete len:121 (+),score=10.63 GHVQ01015757.1:1069-1431(+)